MSTAVQGEVTVSREPTSGRAHTFCIAACGFSILVFGGFVVFGLFDHDTAGATVIGVLAGGVFIDSAVLASNWAGRRARLFVRLTWGVLAVSLLAATLSMLRSGKSDADLLLTYGTALLAFPMGLVAGPITGQLSIPAGQLQTILLWALAIGAGYLHWFVLVPMLVEARAADQAR
jgi:hypothetical protein